MKCKVTACDKISILIYSAENLNGWSGSIEGYYMYQHQYGHQLNWVGGYTGSIPTIEDKIENEIKNKKEDDKGYYDHDLWEKENGHFVWKGGDEYVPPYTDHFEGCCKSFDYGALNTSGMPMPAFMAESRPFNEVASDVQARIRTANPGLFANTDSTGGSGNYGGSGSY